jgi:hypothetical protein
MKKTVLSALALSSVILLAGCNNTPVEEENVVEDNQPEIEIIVDDEQPEIEIISVDDEDINGEAVLENAEEVDAIEIEEVNQPAEVSAEEVAE